MWTLVSSHTAGAPGSTENRLPEEGLAHIVQAVKSKHPGVVSELKLPPELMRELGRIVVGPFGVKLEAIADTVTILPGQPHLNGSLTAKFQLQPRSDIHSEAIFLRHGDVLGFSTAESILTCQWTDSQVQVNSSAAADISGVDEIPGDDTEDEDSGNPTFDAVLLNHKQQQPQPQPQPRATPQLSNQRSITIVQETPTTGRVEHKMDSREVKVNPPNFASEIDQTEEDTPTFSRDAESEQIEQEAEAFSTARTGEPQDHALSKMLQNTSVSSPRVQIPAKSSKKRTFPPAEEQAHEAGNEALAGPTKRAKTSDSDTEDSRSSNVDVAGVGVSPMPSRSQKNSQRSTSILWEDYDGPTPRVACSNSTIAKATQVLKFLKRQGGVYVENLTDEFNVLCVRNGDLQKTPKVLFAIARGTPIVTDQWLYESASAKRLLAVSAFKPTAPKQEKEWKLKLDNILGKPQTPFADYNIHFTKSLKAKYASFPEIEVVGKAAGAMSVTTGVTKMKKTGNNIVLADDGDDMEAQRLMKDGVTCYTKDFFTFSILRGVLDLESDEFKIEGGVAAAETPLKEPKKKRGRKST